MDTQPMEILLAEDNEDDILLEQEALADAKLVNLTCVVMAKRRWPICGARASTKTRKCRDLFS